MLVIVSDCNRAISGSPPMADQKKMKATLKAPYFSSICQLSTTNSSMFDSTCWKLVCIRMLENHLSAQQDDISQHVHASACLCCMVAVLHDKAHRVLH